MGMTTDWSERKSEKITVIVGGRGRNRYAAEVAGRLLQPGEELEQAAESHPTYVYRVKRVADVVLLTPEERESLDDALGMAGRYLAEGLRIDSQTGRDMIVQKMGTLEQLRKKLKA